MNKTVKKPCISCVYRQACGDTSRTEYCAGRMTKMERGKSK